MTGQVTISVRLQEDGSSNQFDFSLTLKLEELEITPNIESALTSHLKYILRKAAADSPFHFS